MAADRPACARLLAVAPAGRSAASYTIRRDTTAVARKKWLPSARIVGMELVAIGLTGDAFPGRNMY